MGKDPHEGAAGKGRNGTGKRFSEGFFGFVDIDLTEADRLELEQWAFPGQVDIEKFLEALCEDGYKFSLAPDVEHHSYVATATGRGPQNVNKGWALSARGPNPLAAIAVLWYKVDVKAHWGPWVGENADGSHQLPLFR
jgi:hypothetical protein